MALETGSVTGCYISNEWDLVVNGKLLQISELFSLSLSLRSSAQFNSHNFVTEQYHGKSWGMFLAGSSAVKLPAITWKFHRDDDGRAKANFLSSSAAAAAAS